MKTPLVSILTPTYDHERFIGACIESVLAQTYPRWEMIIIDDGSKDATPEVVSRYPDARIRSFRQENRGVARLEETYRFAMEKARGELVTILSGDDMWPPQKLERQVPAFEEDGVVACFGRGVIIDEVGREIARVPRGRVEPVLNRPVGSLLKVLLVDSFLPSYTYLIARSAIDRRGGFRQPEGVLGVDSPTILGLALEGEFRFVDEPMGYWRVHRSQNTGNYRIEQARGDTQYALRFFRSLDAGMRAASGWDEGRLAKVLDRWLVNAHFETGRRLLLAGRRREALERFLYALRKGSPATKAKAVVGSFCGISGVDLERVVRLLGRTALR